MTGDYETRFILSKPGIFGIKVRSGVFGIPNVGVIEAFVVTEKEIRIVVVLFSVPRGVEVVINVSNLHDVPCVVFRTGRGYALTCDDPRVQPALQCKAVEEVGVALTYGRAVDQSGIRGKFELIAGIVKVGVVIFDIVADIVVDRADIYQ